MPMKNLNGLWLTLLVAGVAILLFTVGLNIYEGVTNANSTNFSSTINTMPTRPLIDDDLEQHFRESGEL